MAIVSYVRCCKCGGKIKIDLDNFVRYPVLPPHCEKCETDVIEEISHKFGMWPNGWFGHSMEKRLHGKLRYWTVEIEECDDSEDFIN